VLVNLAPTADGIAILTLDRPEKKNALSVALRDEVSDTLDGLASDEDVRVVVLTGAGNTFCAGFDLAEFEVDELQPRLWASSDRFHRTVLEFPLPIIVAVNGAALAGGFDLAIMCDIRIASTTARFAHPEQAWSDVVYSPLHDLIGGAAARDLCFTGRSVDAEEALRIGLVSAVVPPERLASESAQWAGMVAQAPRANLLRTKAKAQARAGIHPGATLDL
jgi:enoyl-CoA hydratase/carnithine racemase